MIGEVPDPRPLTTEPLALDLVNTEWNDEAGRHDLLDDPAGVRGWLRGAGAPPGAPAGDEAVAALRAARTAIRAVVEDRDDPSARDALNAVLARARVAERLGPAGPEEVVEPDGEAWRVPWLAARDLLRLLREHADRVRPCAGEGCVLHFLAVSRSGRRLWCSMAGCGNRAKARRHYARHRPGGGGAGGS